MPKRLSSSANKNSFNLQSLQNLNGMSGSQSVSESVSQSVSLSVSQWAWLPWLARRILSTIRCGFCHSSWLLQGWRILSRCSRAVCSCGMQLGSSKYKKLPAWNNNAPCGPSKTLLPSTSSCTTPPPLPDNFWVMKLALAKRLRDRETKGKFMRKLCFVNLTD